MAGIICAVPFEGVSLSAATVKTPVALVAAANHRIKIRAVRVHTDSVDGTDQTVKVYLQRITTDGTGTAATPRKLGTHSETVQTTAKVNYTVEPTYTANEIPFRSGGHPQGLVAESWRVGGEIELAGGGMIGLRVLAADAQTISGMIEFEE
jgi:hypothetical protein